MKIGNTNWNFDRVVRLTITCPNHVFYTEEVEDANGNKKTVNIQTCVLEYNPLSDSRKVARIDFSCELVPQLKEMTGPNYTAEIKLYNITDELANALANSGAIEKTWAPNKATSERKSRLQSSGRPQVTLEVGYYNHEEPNNTVLYPIFHGFVNSSFSARKGTDYETTLQCWKFDDTIPDSPVWAQFADKREYLENRYSVEVNDQPTPYRGNVLGVIKELIWNYQTTRPAYKDETFWDRLGFSKSNSFSGSGDKSEMSSVPDKVSFNGADDESVRWKKTHEFENVFHLDVTTDATGTYPDSSLKDLLQDMWSDSFQFYPNGETNLDKLLKAALAKAGKGIPLTYQKIENDPNIANGTKFCWYIYEAKDHKRVTPKYENKQVLEITNYQNVIETPVLNGNGSMQIKVMMIPDAWTKSALRLTRTEDDANSVLGMGESFIGTDSISLSAQYGKFAPLLSGAYSANVMINDETSKGYLFNRDYGIWKVTTKGSTHTKDWYTIIQTVPCYI